MAVSWLGTAALVIGAATSAAATPTEADGPSPVSATPTAEPAPTVEPSPAVEPVSGEAPAAEPAPTYPMAPPQPPELGGPATDTVAGEYLVVLKDGTGPRTASAENQVTSAVTRGREAGAEVTHQFSSAVQGYSAALSDVELATVRADPAVDYVQSNQTYRITGSTQQNPTWGLDRVDQRSLPRDKKYYSTATGKGVTAYVVDTGIANGHPDFDLIGPGPSILADSPGSEDCNGHGTHVSGTIGGTRYGVAKDVRLVPIRVFGCDGTGTSADVVAGIDFILQQPVTGPRLANLSIGSDGLDPAVDGAVRRMINAGITVVLAAGNGDARGNGVSACSVSPAHVRSAITVGATTSKDRRATFSNYGSCVDLYAPGTNITSDYLADSQGNWRAGRMSGTSMAAPHVAGTVAMYLQRHPNATPAQVQAALIRTATKNKVTNVSSKWPRLMLLALQKAVAPKSITSGNKLRYNQSLVRGHKLCSNNRVYCLNHGSTGKLQLRKVTGSNKRVVWSAGKNASWTRMTSTGALSSYDAYGRRVWTSKKTGGKATLFVMSGGSLKILRDSDKKLLWSSRG